MINKHKLPKLALEFIGYLITSLVIAAFSYSFLYYISIAIAEQAIANENPDPSFLLEPSFTYWLSFICILASLVVFFTFLLLFLSQKVSYILSITTGVGILKEGNLSYKIDCDGDDELSELADSINSFSVALQNHKENEDKLRKEKDDLIRSLSHDIRTPLTAIISYSDFIKDKKYNNTEELEHFIDIIQNKSYQIKELTNLLLNNQTTHSKLHNHTILDGKLMFEQFISEIQGDLEDNNFNVDVNKLGLMHFNTSLHVQDIARIFDNIYSNIIKYADPKEKVNFSIFIMDENIILNQTNKIKDKSYTNIESNGIGIKNIKQIVNSYNGSVNVIFNNKSYKIDIRLPINL